MMKIMEKELTGSKWELINSAENTPKKFIRPIYLIGHKVWDIAEKKIA